VNLVIHSKWDAKSERWKTRKRDCNLERAKLALSTFTAILHKEDNLYVAQCPEVGTVSQGETLEDALTNIREATELYLEEFPLARTSRALVTTFEVGDVA